MTNDQWGTPQNPGSNPWQNPQDDQPTTVQPLVTGQPSANPTSQNPTSQNQPAQPVSSTSASASWEDTGWLPGSWQGQPGASANPPASAASAAQVPGGQYGAPAHGTDYGTQQPGPVPTQGGWQQGQYPTQTTAPAGPSHQWGSAPTGANATGLGGFFRSLFDLSFRSYVTPSLIKIVYILIIIAAVLYWLGGTLFAFAIAAAGDLPSSMGVFSLLFGWIGPLLFIAMARISLEYMVAIIRTSESAMRIEDAVTKD
ncbi:DUF4282 domain-containing protein [Aestuariimicrobium ganziense]|uniref:DUF4282 domain-containing protein n=1 Tax=Aestuariimicrobium ganziense TaxID=2773677 RepID=UPI0019429A87|nr:DUF4282 domain-containing protein [Aestuariimicrobium ganziense]